MVDSNDLEELQAQIAELQKKAADLLAEKRSAVIEEIKAKIRTYGLSAKDLGLTGIAFQKSTVPVPVKYRLGEATWSGRGRQPKFVVDHLATGGTLEDLLV